MLKANSYWRPLPPIHRQRNGKYPSTPWPSQSGQVYVEIASGKQKFRVHTGFNNPSEQRLCNNVQARVGSLIILLGERNAFLNGCLVNQRIFLEQMFILHT